MQTQGRETLTRSERLRSDRRIDALFNGGRWGMVSPLRFCWTVSPVESKPAAGGVTVPAAGVSVLFSAPKKAFKKAWKRNLIKRRMRESYRRRKHALAEAMLAAGLHIDIALICASSGDIPDFATIDDAISKILEKVLARS